MKAVVWHGVGDIRLDDVPDPRIEQPTDAIVHVTTSAVCGTDLHFVRGSMSDMVPGTVLGHEAVGIVTETGSSVRNLRPGDRVVVPSTIGCGACSYCRAGYFAQCDVANPNGPQAGTAFYGGPKATGPFDGMQAEYVRVPFAHVGPVWLPDEVGDDQAIMLSDIYPTAWFGCRLAQVGSGDTVLVLGAGPVGQFAVTSAFQQGAGRVLVVDSVRSRLDQARQRGAEAIDFGVEDPVEVVRELTLGIGADRVVDAVGIDAQPTPEQALQWAVECVAKAGTIGIIGVYPPDFSAFPMGAAMNKNLTIQAGNCNHRRYLPELLDKVRTGAIDPSTVLTQSEALASAIDVYQSFDQHESGWTKVVLDPAAMAATRA